MQFSDKKPNQIFATAKMFVKSLTRKWPKKISKNPKPDSSKIKTPQTTDPTHPWPVMMKNTANTCNTSYNEKILEHLRRIFLHCMYINFKFFKCCKLLLFDAFRELWLMHKKSFSNINEINYIFSKKYVSFQVLSCLYYM